ncbi:MAG TPA: right-handed parallel beta-helix repeat-containing protein [Actinomycetes bacterium]|jgi:parallel beta-helix repeat protein|nr:right-handed parallel beta-helix repeat-containing protein [Actinomycetes bacterium]
MRKPLYVVAAAVVCLLALTGQAAGANAATRLVSPSGTDAGDCVVSPCATIGYAVSQANAGDTISVAAGTYTESVLIQKQLALVGHEATIDADGHDNGIVISGTAAADTSVRGFTIVNAGLEGIFAIQTADLSIVGNTLMHNDAYGPFDPRCVNEPDDCGEALHLQSVTDSMVSDNLVQYNVGGILLTDENGPTSGNTIARNRVLDNTLDCGITLASHWFQLGAPVAAGVGGVYDNQVLGNVSNGNGAAGVGVFAGPPGAAAYGNVVSGNTAMHNGLPGVAIHAHSPFQYISDNVINNNTLAGNGPDADVPGDDKPTGIAIFSGVVPIAHTTVASNRISDEYYGILAYNALKLSGLPSNKFSSVTVPITTS